MEIQFIEGGVCAPKGFWAGGVHCGIRKNREKKDLALIYSEKECTAAGVYTQNKVKGAPVTVTQQHLANGKAQAVLCNSGNANTCNADGEFIANSMCQAAAKTLNIDPQKIIIGSTGVIGQPLPLQPIVNAMDQLKSSLQTGAPGSDAAAQAIMTTDTKKKEAAVSFLIGGKPCCIGGICKGSGMIHPNMATMLCFMTSDVAISGEMIKKAVKEVTDDTFNMVSVDGDTSTNDTFTLMANGLAGNPEITGPGKDYDDFKAGLMAVCRRLAREMAADGEGATKLLECHVSGAPEKQTAVKVSKAVITSSLLKAAMFGADANWGRILCAVGYADAQFDIGKVGVTLGSAKGTIEVCKNGSGVEFSEEKAKQILLEDEIHIDISMDQGGGEATAWGCDLTYDYVKINGDYRT